MLVLDGHESHRSAAFENYCKAHNIIPLRLPAHSSHLSYCPEYFDEPLAIGFPTGVAVKSAQAVFVD